MISTRLIFFPLSLTLSLSLHSYAPNEIAAPLASLPDTKALYELLFQAAQHKALRRGVKEVGKALRKAQAGPTSLLLLAADVTPLDVYSHLPVSAEEANTPYIFTRSRVELGAASRTKRPTCAVLIIRKDAFAKLFDQCLASVGQYTIKY